MSVKTLASCMQRKKKRKRMSATPVSTRSYTPRIDARTSMEHLLRRPSPGRRWTHRSRRAWPSVCSVRLVVRRTCRVRKICMFLKSVEFLVFHPSFSSALSFHLPSFSSSSLECFFFRCIVPLSVHTLFIFLPFLHHPQFFHLSFSFSPPDSFR